MNARVKTGAIKPGTTSPRLARTTYTRASRFPRRREARVRNSEGRLPPGLKSAVFSKAKTTPVKDWSNSPTYFAGTGAWIVQIVPTLADAFDHQKMVKVPEHYKGWSQISQFGGLFLQAFRAQSESSRGFYNIAGLVPSRETPQMTLNCSKGK